MSLLVASDLDRTLIYSRAAFGTAAGADPDVVCVERKDGEPLSFVTASAHAILDKLAGTGALVPVTSRTIAQYERITLPGPTPRHAICANGGRLLENGVEDRNYRADLESDLAAAGAPLAEVWDVLHAAKRARKAAGTPLKSIKMADDLFCYAVEHGPADPAWVAELADQVAPLGWGVTRQLRKVYLVPNALTKVRALGEVAARRGATQVLAAGDAHLDTSILEYADAAIRPAHGELHDEGWSCPGLQVTSAVGIAAGEEIATWMLEHVTAGPSPSTT